MPAPRVDSMVVVCEKREHPAEDVPAKVFFRVVKAAFSQRRKMLSNCLKNLGLSGDQVQQLLAEAGIDGKRRGESLTMEEFGNLARAYRNQAEP